jgi:hypothetical protein
MLRNHSAAALAAAASFACSMSTSARAADTQSTWQGLLVVTAATAACSAVGGASVGSTLVSVYRPKILTADTNTYLAIYGLRGAFTMENLSEASRKQMHGAGKYKSTYINSRGKPGNNSSVYKLTITPAVITAATTAVSINGTISNYYNTAGCTITVTGGFAPRP